MKQPLRSVGLTGICLVWVHLAALAGAQDANEQAIGPAQTESQLPTEPENGEEGNVEISTSESKASRPRPSTWTVKKLANLDYTAVSAQSGSDAPRNAAQQCDLFLPVERIGHVDDDAVQPSVNKKDFPVVVLVHGGAWVAGDKWNMERHARHLAAHGYAALNINYRLSPAVKFPAHLDDLRLALCWLKANATQYRLDVDRVGLYGYSAGAHLVSLLGCLQDEPEGVVQKTSEWPATDPRWQRLPRIQAVLAGGPPTDFRQVPERGTFYQFFLGGTRQQVPEQYRLASPAAFTSMQDPPICLVQGESDLLVSCKQTIAFAGQCKQAGIDVTLITLPDHGHMTTFLSRRLNEALLDFFGERL